MQARFSTAAWLPAVATRRIGSPSWPWVVAGSGAGWVVAGRAGGEPVGWVRGQVGVQIAQPLLQRVAGCGAVGLERGERRVRHGCHRRGSSDRYGSGPAEDTDAEQIRWG